MKKLVYGSVIALFVVIVASLGYYYFQRYTSLLSDPKTAIPGDAAIVLELTNPKQLLSKMHNAALWKMVTTDPAFKNFENILQKADSLISNDSRILEVWTQKKLLMSLHPSGNKSTDWLFLANIPAGMSPRYVTDWIENQLKNDPWNHREFEDVTISELDASEGRQFSFAISKGILLCSRSSFVLENSIRHLKTGVPVMNTKAFEAIYLPIQRTGQVRAYLNYTGIREMLTDQAAETGLEFLQATGRIAKWTGGELTAYPTGIQLNGYTAASDSTDLINILKQSASKNAHLPELLPARTAWFTWLPFDSIAQTWKKMRSNRALFPTATTSASSGIPINLFDSATGEFCLFITEPASIELENYRFIAVELKNPERIQKALVRYCKESKSGGQIGSAGPSAIYRLPDENTTSSWFGAFGGGFRNAVFSFSGNVVWFAANESSLRTILNDIRSKDLLVGDPLLKNTLMNYGTNSVFQSYANLRRCNLLFRSLMHDEFASRLLSAPSFLKNFSSVFYTIQKENKKLKTSVRINVNEQQVKPATLAWATMLDTALASNPVVLPADLTDYTKIIIAQDKRNQLYFIQPSGRIILKKQLPEPMIGKPHPVDLFKNGTIQYLFTTTTQLYVIDQSGRNAGNFPIRLPSASMGPVSCLKDEKGLVIRIYVPCQNGRIYAYETDGRPVEDWQCRVKVDSLLSPLQIVSTSKGKMLLVHTLKKLQLCSEQGTLHPISFEKSVIRAISLPMDSGSSDMIVLLSEEGSVFRYLPDVATLQPLGGTSGFQSLNAFSDIEGRSWLLLSDTSHTEILPISGEPQQSVPFEAHIPAIATDETNSAPFWGMIDHDSNTMKLFDLTGTLQPGFPVKGTRGMSLITTGDSTLHLLTGASDGTVFLYTIDF